MSKKLIIIITVLVLAAGGIAFAALNKDEMASQRTDSENASQETPSSQPSPAAPDDSTPQAAGAYVDYSSEVIANTSGTKILFFHAPWCPQCRALEASIKEEGVPSGVTIIKVDYDSNQKLRQQYGVTIQTTLVKVDDNGQSVEKYVAYDEPNIDSVKRNLL